MTPSSVSGSPVLNSIERGYKGEPEDVEGTPRPVVVCLVLASRRIRPSSDSLRFSIIDDSGRAKDRFSVTISGSVDRLRLGDIHVQVQFLYPFPAKQRTVVVDFSDRYNPRSSPEVCSHPGEGRPVDLKVCSYTRTLSQIAITDPL